MSQRVAIFGAGISGQAARRLALAKGYETVLFDESGKGDRAVFEVGGDNEFDRFVFSPGFSAQHPWRVLAEQSGILCQSELAFAAEHWLGKIVGVTGTNGKTTLTRLLTRALELSGHPSVSAGNIGVPLSDIVQTYENTDEAQAVCEISSFQAELTDGLELDALLWTNFAEDHLDRYKSMSDYFMAKARLFDCLKEGAIAVVGEQVVDWFKVFGKELNQAVVAQGDETVINQLAGDCFFKRHPFSEDYFIAAEYWWMAGKEESALIEAANTFEPSAHRLNVAVEKKGIRFWDDSKGTNFHATLAALEAVPRPVVWIGGGSLKGGDVDLFAHEVSLKVDAAVVYGEAAPEMIETLSENLETVHHCPQFENAVTRAAEIAQQIGDGASVLMSPGFSSFDQFSSYEERGKSFISIVLGL
ncbi:MAG: UDP-N-acetylmuramoyl-L-alanine--D-glutamate ligase [Verrucomicrobiota bacterium]